MNKCRKCGADIVFARGPNGKWMPMNAKPDPKGLFVMWLSNNERVVCKYEEPVHGDSRRYTSHFATCPNASEFRK